MSTLDHAMLRLAARAALRGMGRVEPNPMVGCVIGRADGTILAVSHHRAIGAPHAEAAALELCARRGVDPRGATAWVTLEPCAHSGRTPPCADALIRAGMARVVAACPDPNPLAAGGFTRLCAAGIACEICPDPPALALRASAAFRKRVTEGLPWVIVKWAQTIDGRIAARSGDSRWISGESSRSMVHRLRGRVDAILTAIGTVRHDDPLLTARNVTIRRVARRCVIDPRLDVPSSALLLDVAQGPVTIFTTARALADRADVARTLSERGIEVVACDGGDGEVNARAALAHLASKHQAMNLLVEAGAGLTSRLLDQRLADELLVFIGGRIMGDAAAMSPVQNRVVGSIADAQQWALRRVARRENDAVLCYSR